MPLESIGIPGYEREVQLLAELTILTAIPNMLKKLLKVHKRTTPFPKVPPKPATGAASTPSESPSALKIVHAGGFVECCYMAIPAVIILEKYPSCKLGRREVFRRPWDSVVRPEELLTLGEKFFLVPRRTVRKLRRRVKKPDGHREVSSNSFASKSCVDVCVDKVSSKSNDFPSTSFCQQSEATVSAEKTASERKSAVKIRWH